ncbi:MAG: ComEC/Rec2 family competence protein [Planctomycetes bacterium]|nr:ComEC/Rec2 family competence protein [Planctomycetota bacterium]
MDGRARDLPGQTGADSRPLLIPALAFLGGILFADAFPHPAAPAIAIGGVALCAALAWLAHAGADRRAAVAALAAVAFGAGIARLAHERRIDPRDIGRAGEGAAEIEGVIARPPEAFGASGENDGAPPGSWFLLDVERVAGAEGWRDARGTVRVVVGEGTPALRGGDRVRATGWLAAPRGARNPGEFDFAAHLARSGIRRLLRVGRPASVVVEGRGPWPEVARGVLRERIARGLDAAGPRGALYRALLLGDRSALAPDLEQAFVTSGTAHVLAVSGLNLVLVIAMAAGLARLLGAGARGAGLAALAFALG